MQGKKKVTWNNQGIQRDVKRSRYYWGCQNEALLKAGNEKAFRWERKIRNTKKIRFYIVNLDLEDENNDTITKVQPLDKQE